VQLLLLKRAHAAKRSKTHLQPTQEVMVAQATHRVLSVKTGPEDLTNMFFAVYSNEKVNI